MAPNPATVVGEDVLVKAHEGDTQVVTAWLDEGGGVDARCAEHHDETLLISAAAGGQEAMVRMLLQRGAGVNLQDSDGVTALMYAATIGHTTTVQVLLDAKADASLQATNGRTALMAAEDYKHTATAQLLRQHAKRQTTEAEAAVVHATTAAPTPSLSGRRVRIDGLKGRPELNGRCGVAGRFDAAKGWYEVAVEGEAEAVLLKPMNLQEVIEPASSALTP
jgi:ankyrin repeat protein